MSEQRVTVLAVESSAGPASCAIWRFENETATVLSRSAVNNRLTHSQTLMPMIQDALRNAALTLDDVSHLAVAVGPGSFTGVRIGVAAVKGIAFPNDLPCVAVSTLAAMARRWDGVPYDGLILTAMDARCQQVYTALFDCKGGTITRLTEDEALPIAELKTRLSNETRPIVVMGDGAEICYTALCEALPTLRLAPPHLRFQDANGVAVEALDAIRNGNTKSGEELLPSYLRLPQAERELKARQQEHTS